MESIERKMQEIRDEDPETLEDDFARYNDDDRFPFALGRAVNHGRGAKNRSNLWSSQRRLSSFRA